MANANNIINAEKLFAQKQESEWIMAAQKGDRRAFARLYQLYIARVYGLCFRMLSNREQAEDVAQEVFVQVWQKLNTFKGDAKFSTWLHAVATNSVLSYLRKNKSWMQKVFSIETQSMLEPCEQDMQELSDIDKAILQLPEKARLVFVLFAIEGYRHEEIANLLNMAVGTSKAQYHRARNLLKERLST